ncbi:MAG: CPBP family intramembrane metalloprotease [Roseofilum sp. SBFL]|uniref:CPBP family glutamic-type intramembrane protease n=2 Tax=Roseofilum TaxID=1233426 RepID=UPI000E9E7A2D|nr:MULTISPECIES: CPBP family glutamic-type intramembrane protease [unclassified Roseofilum]HBQ99367.1 CPBP family intramembrane metalloprotease [Cyanobacteria bacterium UBA11691]MBP0014625.1 CPBP family intramembrane metalloprotease [Roseofilum sp. SID3]MBP0026022.1 CPBP family intramembrane metalloprotease [Roseofilum sp. SID2]MBP0033595.1 CPBP family intramembrane metalloprotease [Roseofilum sp. Belize BBD 4]MBP0038321.1 CPBP family intramembrane metalloprotease [Roseofilum sp. SID1]
MMIDTIVSDLSHRFSITLIHLPSLRSLAIAALLLGFYALIALPLGFYSQFLSRTLVRNKKIQLQVMIQAIATPALSEEVVFRVLLLPNPQNSPTLSQWLLWGSISLILFILYHPINGLLFFPPGRKVFQHPIFLTLAALLGVICTLSYAYSGCLWIPALIHWVIVVIWLLKLGGYEKLSVVAPEVSSL